MDNIIIFAGTTEGRRLTEILSKFKLNIIAVVATEYGSTLIEKQNNVEVIDSRLSESEMITLIQNKTPKFVVDATHPYALIVTENIKKACLATKAEYIRLLRSESDKKADIYVKDIVEAGQKINEISGNVLVTTGSKELHILLDKVKETSRLYCRMLPTKEVIDKCHELEMSAKNIIAMQGPFTKEFNIALCKMLDIDIILTKDGGKVGGYDDKIECARELGLKVITIGRNSEEIGVSFEECVKKITKTIKKEQNNLNFPFFMDISNKKVLIVGGGNIACRRLNTISKFCKNITLVAPKIIEKIKSFDEISIIHDEFQENYLNDIDICLACTDNRQVNHQIFELCSKKNIAHSICDAKEECSFYFAGIEIHENVAIAVCGDGTDHKKTKNVLEKLRGTL